MDMENDMTKDAGLELEQSSEDEEPQQDPEEEPEQNPDPNPNPQFVTLHLRKRYLHGLAPSKDFGKIPGWGPLEKADTTAFVPTDNSTLPVLHIPLDKLRGLSDTLNWVKHMGYLISGHKTGYLVCKSDDPDTVAVPIADDTPLPTASTEYVYEPPAQAQHERCIFLLRIVDGRIKVGKVATAAKHAETAFPGSVAAREGSLCKISGLSRLMDYYNTSSHLVPARLGAAAVQSVLVRLGAATNPAGDLDWGTPYKQWHFDPRVGVLLHAELNLFVDRFKMGFYRYSPTGNESYEAHHLNWPIKAADQDVDQLKGWTKLSMRWDTLVLAGLLQDPVSQNQVERLNLHGLAVDFPTGNTNGRPNPTFEVLSWHYAQCVVRKWGTTEYKEFTNVKW
ncbi:hypothetical protein B0T22DRAFT_518675 [Podospora appendiculata]|uniref:Uncharacterized protein n=1 Tax=Podospora appendiculata TaxID=314037 RepID=A0AAE1CB09_9PEZI|nr:hypothetical protein B0T22DRAFT_518675 [Podospora appendiculata]